MRKNRLRVIRRMGDVSFYISNDGKKYQKIADGNIVPVKKRKDYIVLMSSGEYTLCYELSGHYGFTIMCGGIKLADNIWELAVARIKFFEFLSKEDKLCYITK